MNDMTPHSANCPGCGAEVQLDDDGTVTATPAHDDAVSPTNDQPAHAHQDNQVTPPKKSTTNRYFREVEHVEKTD